MKTVSIKYNPYLVSTEILVDGRPPKTNSALNAEKKRLQEWVDQLPQILLDEYKDGNLKIEFVGTVSDYEDIVSAFEPYKDKIAVEFSFKKTADISDVEKRVDKIFKEIQNGPVPELKDESIVQAFKKAKNALFEVNVVATMSSGKSTLINALLGKQLMPAANEATTATIVKIVNTDQDNFSAIAYDKSGQIVQKIENVELEDMKNLNNDKKVSIVELRGKIPFVSTVGMKLVLVDTPGPNNSRDKNHEEMTYRMISDSDKSLVLYVMNAQQLGINDEKIFLDYVCDSMKKGGKQGRERFIFAVNKMDAFKPKDEGLDCINRALSNVKDGLEGRGILNPNIFPVTAGAALELRTEDDEPQSLDNFRRSSKKYEAMRFNEYYKFTNLPLSVKRNIDELLEDADDDERLEIYTGIVSIEQAIAQFINKYARTTKICDLVASFNDKLNDLAAVAHLQEAIRKDKDAKKVIENQIRQIKANIQSAQAAQERSKAIDSIDLKPVVEAKVKAYIDGLNIKLSRLMSGRSNKVEKKIAMAQCQELEKECQAISLQIKVQIDQILAEAYKSTITKIVEEYKRYLAELNLGVNGGALTFNPVNLVSGSLSDLNKIIADNTETKDESYTKTEYRTVRKEGSFLRKAASFLTFGMVDNYTTETKAFERRIAKYVDYVDMNEVASDFITPFQKNLKDIHKQAVDHVCAETNRLKNHLKQELTKIDKVLNDKLSALSQTEESDKAKAADIAKKESDLRWLENIQKEVNAITKF